MVNIKLPLVIGNNIIKALVYIAGAFIISKIGKELVKWMYI